MPQELRCPKCKNPYVQVQFIEVGSKTKRSGNGLVGHTYNAARGVASIATLGLAGVILPKAKGKNKTTNKLEKMAICQRCGHSWRL